jgi:hypothetical protein
LELRIPRHPSLRLVAETGQLVRGMRLNIETHTLLPKSVGEVLNCASYHLNGGTVADGSPSASRPCSRVMPRASGSGLGLTIARMAATRVGARIELEKRQAHRGLRAALMWL